MNLSYVCSPYSGNVPENLSNARKYCKSVLAAGYIPVAPHIYFTQFLDDTDPVDRKQGIDIGLKLIESCSFMYVFGDTISSGMEQEIAYAKSIGKQIIYINSEKLVM